MTFCDTIVSSLPGCFTSITVVPLGESGKSAYQIRRGPEFPDAMKGDISSVTAAVVLQMTASPFQYGFSSPMAPVAFSLNSSEDASSPPVPSIYIGEVIELDAIVALPRFARRWSIQSACPFPVRSGPPSEISSNRSTRSNVFGLVLRQTSVTVTLPAASSGK
ncbi:hypothetical protein SDC9_85770 [bioreactor metagenome]|uniref:Uncharacterized protein n=1 Tax=bioreactor metagenome TaxID=1076179 RepID=A0A644ZEL6_9ZZZZ